MLRIRQLAPLVSLLLAGCGGIIEAPSLGTRDVEKTPVSLPDEAREPGSTLDAALAAKLKTLLDQANAAHTGFTAAAAKAEAAIRRAGGAGSETWIAAQQELSLLDTARAPLQGIEADVDALRTDPANATPANRTAIDTAAAQVQALGDQENDAVAALGARLKS